MADKTKIPAKIKSGKESFRDILQNEFVIRRSKNSAYSQRAFARDIGLSPSRISEVLNGGQRISRQKASVIADALGLDKSNREYFCNLVDLENPKNSVVRRAARQQLGLVKRSNLKHWINTDVFASISEWYHAAILELVTLRNAKHNPEWISKALGITERAATDALNRLQRLNLLRQKNKKFVPIQSNFGTTEDIPSSAIRSAHKQFLGKALESVESQTIDERRLDTLVLTIDRKQLPKAFLRMKDFCTRFNAEFGSSSAKNSVYCLSIQFFKLAEEGNSHE
jgi:uncharacterized protein (TIGR02147 family)